VKLNELRSKGRRIFYVEKTWVENNLTLKECWQTDEAKTFLVDSSAKNSLIVVHAGSEDGFITDAQLMYSTKEDQ
jgi:hypothetical protein